MLEYQLTIEFVSPCLGNTRKEWSAGGRNRHYLALPRTNDGRITFQPTWWRANLRKAAPVLARDLPGLESVMFDALISGTPACTNPAQFYRRYYATKIYALHEAFLPGERLSVRVLSPPELPVDLLRAALETSGRFYGISPARPGEFGFFQVLDLSPYCAAK